MAPIESLPPDHDIERLLSSLEGVLSARIAVGARGRIEEIHVLAEPGFHPKQVARNVESALRAGLDIEIDRRIISVAHLRNGSPGNGGRDPEHDGDAADAPPDPGPEARLLFAGYDARSSIGGPASCRVTLRLGDDEFAGSGEGPNTQQGRAEAAARAVFDALANARGSHDLGLEGAALLESHGRTYVLVSARAFRGRDTVPLAGAAPLERSPEEAAILAALQATNRWAASPP